MLTGSHYPALIYDGDCGFCTGMALWLTPRLQAGVRLVAWQCLSAGEYGLAKSTAQRAVHFVDERGRHHAGHLAVAWVLGRCRAPGWRLLGWMLRMPPVRWLGGAGYKLVSRVRGILPAARPALLGGCAASEWWSAGAARTQPTVGEAGEMLLVQKVVALSPRMPGV